VAAPTAARTAALETLRAVRAGTLAGRALDDAAGSLPSRERAWVQELVYGTLRLRGRLDHRLAALSSRPLDQLDPDILDILRLGAYQLTEMGGVPAYAAVSEAVELARRAAGRGGARPGRGASGFVNAVLQSLRRSGGAQTFPEFEADPVGHLSTWGSHPRWLVERWLARYGAGATRRLVELNNQRPELYLRVLGDAAAAVGRLQQTGVAVAPVPGVPGALRLEAGALAVALEAAAVIVQDPAAGLVASYVAAPPAGRVLDLAAAPGGKALALAWPARPDGGEAVADGAGALPAGDGAPADGAGSLAEGAGGADTAGAAGGPGFVAAADISLQRLERLSENVARLRRCAAAAGVELPIGVVVADGRRPPFGPADVVLLDAPCTGTGTLRRHPDGRWRLRPGDIVALARLQRELLDAAAECVRPGGLLVYATCSLEPEENEAQVEAFLERNPNFEIERGPALPGSVIDADGTLRVLPHEHGWDGAWAARMRRRG
jgi:16S rRNA (cytosine967-C5)-methyltransferase